MTSIYFHGFMNGSIYRESCHFCKYTKHERVSDITLGDADYGEGGEVYSSVIIYTAKGEDVFLNLPKMHKVEADLDKMLASHSQLNAPVPENKEQKKFIKYCGRKNIKYALIHMNRKKMILIKIRRAILNNRLLYSFCSRVSLLKKLCRT